MCKCTPDENKPLPLFCGMGSCVPSGTIKGINKDGMIITDDPYTINLSDKPSTDRLPSLNESDLKQFAENLHNILTQYPYPPCKEKFIAIVKRHFKAIVT